MSRTGVIIWAVNGLLALAGSRAAASCRVTNETGYTFTVASGNVANQRIRAHATAAIEAGKIQGKSEEGKTISGSCKDGGELVIQEKNGVPLLLPKKGSASSGARLSPAKHIAGGLGNPPRVPIQIKR
jgi:hypothetical protein